MLAGSLGGGKSRQLQRETSTFTGVLSFTLAATAGLHVEENPLVEKKVLLFAIHWEF